MSVSVVLEALRDLSIAGDDIKGEHKKGLSVLGRSLQASKDILAVGLGESLLRVMDNAGLSYVNIKRYLSKQTCERTAVSRQLDPHQKKELIFTNLLRSNGTSLDQEAEERVQAKPVEPQPEPTTVLQVI